MSTKLTTLILKPPLAISARFLPAVYIGDDWLSIEHTGYSRDGRCEVAMHFDFADGTEHTEEGLKSGVGDDFDPRKMLKTALSFLSAAAESYDYAQRMGHGGENTDLFPPNIVEWASQHSDEISMLAFELEEGQS